MRNKFNRYVNQWIERENIFGIVGNGVDLFGRVWISTQGW